MDNRHSQIIENDLENAQVELRKIDEQRMSIHARILDLNNELNRAILAESQAQLNATLAQ